LNHIKYFVNSLKVLLLFFYFSIIILLKLIRKKRLIIVSDKYGRLGNRLYLFSQFIIFCKKYNYELWIPGFYEYKTYFSNDNYLLSFQSSIGNYLSFINEEEFYYSIVRIVNFIKRFKKFNHISLSFQQDNDGNPWERILDTKFPIVFFEGFIFYKYKIDAGKNFFIIKGIFQPAARFHSEITEPIHSLRKDNDFICGILIRQTDYITWQKGKYFFKTDDYINFINIISSVLYKYRIGFFIATDQKQNEKLFSNINCVLRIGEPIENLYTLSYCDFLVGPPSSYIGWSAFYGQKDLFTIESIIQFESSIKYFLNTKFRKHKQNKI